MSEIIFYKGHLKLIRITYSCRQLALLGHLLSKNLMTSLHNIADSDHFQ